LEIASHSQHTYGTLSKWVNLLLLVISITLADNKKEAFC